MNRELAQSFRGRTYSEGSDYLSSGDDITDNEEKQTMVALLKECGETYVDHIQITSNEEVQNHDDKTQLPNLHFEAELLLKVALNTTKQTNKQIFLQ